MEVATHNPVGVVHIQWLIFCGSGSSKVGVAHVLEKALTTAAWLNN